MSKGKHYFEPTAVLAILEWGSANFSQSDVLLHA